MYNRWNENETASTSIPAIHALGYSGGLLSSWSGERWVIDLSSLSFHSGQLSALRQHNPEGLVGHWDYFVNNGKELHLYGKLSGPKNRGCDPAVWTAAAQENGYRWPASIGLTSAKEQACSRKKIYEVNGRNFTDIDFILFDVVVHECSAVTSGRDPMAYFEILGNGFQYPQNAVEIKGNLSPAYLGV